MPGAYNYETIRVGNYLFEVECYGNVNGDDPGFVALAVANLEACAAACGTYNDNNPVSGTRCVGAIFFAGFCYRKSTYGIPNFDLSGRSIRLISADYGYPAVNDQMKLVPLQASSTLCVGPASTAFAYQTAIVQRPFDNTPQWKSLTNQNYAFDIQCNRQITGNPSTNPWLTAYTTGGGTLLSYEDCLRYCEYSNERVFNTCNSFTWNNQLTTCTIYTSFATGTTQASTAGIHSGRLFYSGSGYNNGTDRPT